jgi:beta-lactamase regulating signal transducer with metallopeptidase domain
MIPALVNHLWQSTLFALGAGLLTLALRKNGAGVRYGLWLAASVKFLVPFALLAAVGGGVVARLHLMVASPPSFALPSLAMIAPLVEPLAPASVTSAPASVMSVPATLPAAPHMASLAHHAAAIPFDPAPILLGVWALGLAVVLLVWAVRWSRIRAALSAASPIDLPAHVPVLSSPALLEPGVIGIRRPVLLVPEGIAERLSPAELRAVIDHELCHIRRRDNLTGAVHMLVEALFWFHPLVWWLGARLIAERERACDEAVVRASDPRTYAEAILKICRLYLRQPLPCAAGVSGANLKRRMLRIMADPISVRLSVPKKLLLAAAAVLSVAAPVSAGLFASVPTAARAQADPSKPGAQGRMRQALEAQTPATPQASTPIVLAALETALSPVPAVARADSRDSQVVAGLSQAAPDLPAIAAAPSQPASAPAVTQAEEPQDAHARALSFVKSYAATTRWFGQITRWDDPICVGVEGLKPDQAAAVTARVLAVANAAGVGAPRSLVQPLGAWRQPTCRGANVQIRFTTDPQRALDDVVAHNDKLLGDADAKTRTITRPIQAWYMIDADADPMRTERAGVKNPAYLGGRNPISRFINVMVIVDLRRTGDTRLGPIADDVAMLALSQPRSPDHCNVSPSVTDLFAGSCPGRSAPDGLTATDTAYLSALYGRPDIDVEGDPSDIAGRMARSLAVAAPNAPPRGSGASDEFKVKTATAAPANGVPARGLYGPRLRAGL